MTCSLASRARCQCGLVDRAAGEGHGEDLDRRGRKLGHYCGDRARIDPARHERADLDVGHQVVLDGLAQALPGFLDPVGFGHPLVHTQPRAPEARGARFAIAPDRQDRARLEADNLAVDRARGLDVAVGKEFVDRAIIDGEAVAGQHPQRADFRGEGDSAVLLGDVERLDPQRVARQSEHALAPVPDRGGAHPFEPQPGFVAAARSRTPAPRHRRSGCASVRERSPVPASAKTWRRPGRAAGPCESHPLRPG